MADLKLCSPKDDIYSRFGFSMTTSSNEEGNYEIYIGAPTLGMNNLTYQGVVYYYESYINEIGEVVFSVIVYYINIFNKHLIKPRLLQILVAFGNFIDFSESPQRYIWWY